MTRVVRIGTTNAFIRFLSLFLATSSSNSFNAANLSSILCAKTATSCRRNGSGSRASPAAGPVSPAPETGASPVAGGNLGDFDADEADDGRREARHRKKRQFSHHVLHRLSGRIVEFRSPIDRAAVRSMLGRSAISAKHSREPAMTFPNAKNLPTPVLFEHFPLFERFDGGSHGLGIAGRVNLCVLDDDLGLACRSQMSTAWR